MIGKVLGCVIAVLSVCSVCSAQNAYESLRDSLQRVELDSANGRLVDGLMFEDGLITLSLDSGIVVPLRTVGGRALGLVFQGHGTVTYSPNIATEAVNLRRFYPHERFVEEVTSIIVVCTDGRLMSMLEEHKRLPLVMPGMNELAKLWRSYVVDEESGEVDMSLARTMLNNGSAPLLYVHGWRDASKACVVRNDPYALEPYSLTIPTKLLDAYKMTMVCQCPDPSGLPQLASDGTEPMCAVSTQKHVVQCDIQRSLDINVRDEVQMTVRTDSVQWISFLLTSALKVDSVLHGTTRLKHARAKDGSAFWVQLPRMFRRGEPLALAMYFHGDVIDRVEDYTVVQTSIDWLPSHKHTHKALYDVTYSYPSSMKVFSVGVSTEPSEAGDRTLSSRWTTSIPNSNHSFHIGLFRSRPIPAMDRVPNATVHYITSEQVDAVALDVQQSLQFFTNLFGPIDVPQIHATELPGDHGEAFPGLLHLSSYAFFRSSNARYGSRDASTDEFFGEQFTSHEVAHQWWGISVKPKTYRDRYISEGFAEYSSLMYSQLAAREGAKFFRLLDEYRTKIFDYGRRVVGDNLAPPPIDLGHRVSNGQGQFGGAYSTFVYKKGAWVLHMLRNMMLDLRTMKEDVFMTVMREFYKRHKGGHASTEDLRTTIQDVTGADLGWFFDEWVYGNQLPTYRVAWKKAELPKQEWGVVLQVTQEGVSDDFVMLVPVKIVGDDGQVVRARVTVRGPFTQIELPHTNFEPDDVIFNDLSSVLCDVKTASFKVEEKK